MARKLTQDEMHALGAMIHQSGQSRVYWPGASWVGVCTYGHVNVAAHSLRWCMDAHPEPTRRGACGAPFVVLPEHDALLAAFKVGGWDALVEAANAVIASSEGG